MIDPDFLADLQRIPDSILAEYELTDDERATVRRAAHRSHPTRGHLGEPDRRAVGSSADTLVFLRSVRLFRDIEGPELGILADSLHERPLKQGQVLLREGDRGDEMFLVRSGSLVISKAVTGRVEQVLARVGPGDFFGEMALFDRSPRSATIQADADAVLLVLDRPALAKLTEVSPRAAAAFFESLVLIFIERLRASGDLVAEVTRWGLEATGLDVETR